MHHPDLSPLQPETFRRWQEDSRLIDRAQVVLIVGPPKTGTTWLAAALGGHPQAAVSYETHAANHLLPLLRNALRVFSASRARWGSWADGEPDAADAIALCRQAIDRILIRAVRADSRWNANSSAQPAAIIEKTPTHALHVEELATLYPAAKFICCTRDVRDSAVSAWGHFAAKGWVDRPDFEGWALHYAREIWAPCLRAARTAGARLGADQYAEIEYSDHKRDPAGEIRRLLRFIEIDDSESAVRACLEAGDFKRLSGGRKPGEAAKDWSFYRKGVAGDWVNHMTPEFGDRLLRESATAVADLGREGWLRECLWRQAAQRCVDAGARRVALFGAGAHAEAMLDAGWPNRPDLEVAAILDDAPKRAEIRGLPVRTPRECPRGVEAIVIASDTHEDALAASALRCAATKNLPIVRIYGSPAVQPARETRAPALAGSGAP